MAPEQRAIVGGGGVLGQAIVCGPWLLAPLHVIDAPAPLALCCVGPSGRRQVVRLTRVAARVGEWDAILYRSASAIAPALPARVVGCDPAVNDVEVLAIVCPRGGDVSQSRLTVCGSRVVRQVRVDCHTYQTASGRLAVAVNQLAIFLATPMQPGWSGAPVYVRGTSELLGFIHGNASANGGNALCLPPPRSDNLFRAMRRLNEVHTGD